MRLNPYHKRPSKEMLLLFPHNWILRNGKLERDGVGNQNRSNDINPDASERREDGN